MENNKSVLESLHEQLIATESLASTYLPLNESLDGIKNDLNSVLNTLKNKAANSTDIADRTFYVNKYLDLVKNVESVFDARSKRIQQAIGLLIKTSEKNIVSSDEIDSTSDDDAQLTPEQANEILKILKDVV